MIENETKLTDRRPKAWGAVAENGLARNAFAALLCAGTVLAACWLGAEEAAELSVWFPLGVALAVVLLWGPRIWPGVFLGMLLAGWCADLPWLSSLGRAAGDTMGVLIARFLLHRFGRFPNSLERVQDVLALFYFGALAGPACSAGSEVLVRSLAGPEMVQGWLAAWGQVWLRDSLGVLTLTPLLLALSGGVWRPRDLGRFMEAVCLVSLLVGAALLVFGESYATQLAGYPVAYVVFIFSIWSALRFGPRGAAATVFLVAALSLRGATWGFGPMEIGTAEDMALLWSVFNGVFAVCTLILAAVIAERRYGEEALRTSEVRYRHLFSHAPISIWEEDFSKLVRWLADLRGRGITDLREYFSRFPQEIDQAARLVQVTDINDVTLKLFEADQREQLLGELAKSIHSAARQFFVEEVLAIWEGRTRFENEVEGYTLKKNRIDYLLHWDASTESGPADWTHVIVALMDITERSRLRNEFRQVQKMEAVGRLAGGIAHDFNNIIMTIQGYSTLLLGSLGENPARRDEVAQIKRAAERAASLTRQLLVFSRKQVMKLRVLDLNTVVSEMNKMLCRLIGEHIQLEKKLAPDLGWIKADPGQLEQVIVNLAVNARDAMPHGGRLVLETRNVEIGPQGLRTQFGLLRPGPYVLLSITDTGTGMSAEVKAQCFDPFFTTKGAEHGTGLGLSTVYGIIKQSGGEISVESKEGQGTTFQVHLPRVGETELARRTAQLPAPSPRGVETLLVVEDEDLVRELLCKTLNMHGYTVLEAASGMAALTVAERNPKIDLLVTDVVMPQMNGKDLAEILLQSRPRLRVLFQSGYVDGTILRDERWRGRAGFLEKPFPPSTLLLKVRDMLDGTQLSKTAEDERENG